MNIAVPCIGFSGTTPELVSQQAIDTHFRLGLPFLGHVDCGIQHCVRRADLVNDTIGKGLFAGVLVRFQQNFSRHLRTELQAYEGAHPIVVQTYIDGGHLPETPLRVHDAIVVSQRQQTGPTKNMTGDEGDGGKWKIKHCM